MVDVRQTTPDYLRVMRLTLQHGRWLAPSDIRGGQPVVVVLNDEQRGGIWEANRRSVRTSLSSSKRGKLSEW